jgi:hypothetical protein
MTEPLSRHRGESARNVVAYLNTVSVRMQAPQPSGSVTPLDRRLMQITEIVRIVTHRPGSDLDTLDVMARHLAFLCSEVSGLAARRRIELVG